MVFNADRSAMTRIILVCFMFHFRHIGAISRAVSEAPPQIGVSAVHADETAPARLEIVPVLAFDHIAAVIAADPVVNDPVLHSYLVE